MKSYSLDSCLEVEVQNTTQPGKQEEKRCYTRKATNCYQVILLSLVMLTDILVQLDWMR